MLRTLHTILRRTLIVLLVCCILAGGLLFYRAETVVAIALDSLFARYSIQNGSFNLSEVTKTKLRLQALSGCLDTANAHCFSATSLTVTYDLHLTTLPVINSINVEGLQWQPGTPQSADTQLLLSSIIQPARNLQLPKKLPEVSINGRLRLPAGNAIDQAERFVDCTLHLVRDTFRLNCGTAAAQIELDTNGHFTSGTLAVMTSRLLIQDSPALTLNYTANQLPHLRISFYGKSYESLTALIELINSSDLPTNFVSRHLANAETVTLSFPDLSAMQAPHPFQLTANSFSLFSQEIVSATLSGTLTDNFHVALTGDAKSPHLSDPIVINKLSASQAGLSELDLSISSNVETIPESFRSYQNKSQRGGISSGLLQLHIQKRNSSMSFPLSLTLKNCSAYFGAALVSDCSFSTSGEWFFAEQEWRFSKARLAAAELNAGVALSSVNLEMKDLFYSNATPSKPRYRGRLNQATAQIFGGSIKVLPFSIASETGSFLTNLELSTLQLPQIMELYDKETITASGEISGNLPLQYNHSLGAAIKEGTLQSHPPGGRIAIGEKLVKTLSGTPGMELAAKALQNYQYTSLRSTVDYASSGILKLGLSMEGRSPELNTSRPVHVNLNVEQNILKLIRSLSIVSEVEREIYKASKK